LQLDILLVEVLGDLAEPAIQQRPEFAFQSTPPSGWSPRS
jgi:hypothetical protein